jgi:diguanylate cyclase (GGDEF)-like protein
MERVLVIIENTRDRRAIEEWLSDGHEVLALENGTFPERFDLAIVDGPSLRRLNSEITRFRRAQEPVLVPFLLLAMRRKGSRPVRHLGNVVDDLIFRPVDRAELQARVGNLLRLRRLSMQLKREHDRVSKLSVTDDVSGFHNTRYLHRMLDRLLADPDSAEEISLVFFDLDNFKRVVDTHGHMLGAKVLKEVAQCVDRELSEEDRIVRYGGDEFVVILPRQGKEAALRKVERIRAAISSSTFLQKENINASVTASFGLATFPHDAADKRALLAEADRCLFRSKAEGKNQVRFSGEMELLGQDEALAAAH